MEVLTFVLLYLLIGLAICLYYLDDSPRSTLVIMGLIISAPIVYLVAILEVIFERNK